MYGILTQNPKYHVQQVDASFTSINGGGFGPSGNIMSMSPIPLVGQNTPTQQFDISALSGKRDSDRFGSNLVGDIRTSYQTYISGTPVGRGGQFAVDAARRFGTTVTEAARGYLVTAGLPTLAEIISPIKETVVTNTPFVDPDTTDQPFFALPVKDITTNATVEKNPFEILADILPTLFGNAVYNPPLQNQASGFTGVDTSTPLSTQGSGGFTMYIVIAVVAIAGYFLYKRFA